MTRRRLTRDDGLSLIELAVAMMIAAIVLSVVFAFLVRAMSSEKFNDQESQALAELRVAATRFTREVRQARLVLDQSTSSVRLWIDLDRDNVQEPAEDVTWRIEETTLRRETAGGAASVVATGLVRGANKFEATGSTITATFVVDIDPDRYASERKVVTEVQLRNAQREP